MGCAGSSEEVVEKKIDKKKDKVEVQKKETDEAQVIPSEPELEQIDVPLTEDGYPPPKPPSLKKNEIYNPEKFIDVDKHARRTSKEVSNSYDELMEYLVKPFRTDLQRLRAIFVWLSIQEIEAGNFSDATDADSPKGFMRLISEKKGSFATFFALLCRKANLPCVIIPGVSKSVGYEVGNQDVSTLRNRWNAVYVNHSWRIVHPLWACRCVEGHKTGSWTLVETGGTGVRQQERASSGISMRTFNEYYFLTDPQEFIFFCLPDSTEWQLINSPFTIEKYVSVPFLRQAYFLHGLRLSSDFGCIQESVNGTLTIQMKVPDKSPFQMTYDLYYNHKESTEKISSSVQLDHYVMMNKEGPRWNFITRFPVNGVYKMSIFGNEYDVGNLQWIANFKLLCSDCQENSQPFPDNPDIGFGPGFMLEKVGLQQPSHKSGLVEIRTHREVSLTFAMSKKISVKSQLVHNTISEKQLSKCVSQTVKNNKVDIGVNVTQSGEYALKVFAKDNEPGAKFKNVCNYLLTTENMKKTKKHENAFERNVRRQMIEATHKRDPTILQITMDKFLKNNLDDKGDYVKAEDKLEILKLQKELNDAINRRHLETLDKAIGQGQASRFAGKVTHLVDDAIVVRDHLRQLDRFAHEVLEMKQPTISEIHSYKKPPHLIYDVMYATCLILGEKEYHIDDWENIQTLMRKTGKESLIRKIRQFDTARVQTETMQRASAILDKYDEMTVRLTSAGAGTFYVWARNIVGHVLAGAISDDNNN